MITHLEKHRFLLENFEGPLGLLLFLIQKNEISIDEISISPLTQQYQDKITSDAQPHLDGGAEFIGTTAFLLWLKSKALLPVHEQMESLRELALDPQFDVIHSLIDYCRFKEAAKMLHKREEKQKGLYTRGQEPIPEIKKSLGISHLTLQDLSQIFQALMVKAPIHTLEIQSEPWTVQEKITLIQQLFNRQKEIPFHLLFASDSPRLELIVTFLAVLELMKRGEMQVIQQLDTQQILMIPASAIRTPA